MVLSRIRAIKLRGALSVIPNVYQLTVRGVNIIVIAEDELTLIDTGFRGCSPQVVDFISSLGRSVTEIGLVIITHSHYDHAGGLAELRRLSRARVAAHRADVHGLERPPYPPVIKKLLCLPPIASLPSVFSLPASEVDIQLAGGEVLPPLGGLEVIPTPGHTPGSISLFSPQHRWLMVGDALNRGGDIPGLPPRMVTADLTQAIDSVKRIARLDVDIICFGHGRPLTGGAGDKVQKLLTKN